ncbi:T9SS type B sorting domain-containing protein [Pedobacter cryotolerans]|uniref:DUF11 domain-containing protein n=1 Tax=Pedobacter cryotolerans TaxID=2571270 RepID=A0A4U1BYJ0_9SPHI|nr:gliding motility-associated C-terminal domain-containing protein [Pedobacter cryotolerans]TKB98153.1 DUF11 domain-containing protein [Pedobacter cryotolerans]
MKKILLLLLLSVSSLLGFAQAPTYINTTFNINAGVPVTWYGDVTFGPNAIVYIEDGAMGIFYGKNMIVDPGATFIALPGNNQIGTGTIIFKENNPNHPGYPLQQTLNGGFTSGNNPSLLNIELDNANGLSLSGNARVTNQVKFTKGHIYLNNFNLVLGASASLSNYDVSKHVVTNGTGVLTKEGIANNGSFIYPVSIAGSDYTPATVTNNAALRNISAQVKDYATSAAIETTFVTKGMERTWQITSNVAGAATVTLQHNSATNTNGSGTNESAFNNELAFVSQQITSGVWSQSCSGTNGGNPISINTGNNFNLPTTVDATAFFSKKTVNCTDLMVTKTVNNTTPTIGNNLIFTIVAKNNGVVDASGVTVTDLLPSGYTYVSATASSGTYNLVTGMWAIGNLANGISATLTITVTVNATGLYANTATIEGTETDPDLSNNSSTVTPTPGAIQANLGVLKTVDIAAPTIGNNVVFTVAVNNAGPNNATNVKVTDMLPAGYTFISSTVTAGSFNQLLGTWTIGDFANGATATMTITARVNAVGPYANTAVIAGAELDPVPANNTSTVTPIPNAAKVDLSIIKTTPIASTSIGEEFTYELNVKNIGVNLATEVLTTDILPAGLTYVSASTNNGTFTFNSGTRTLSWNIGQLAVGANVVLTIKVKTDDAGLITNTATVGSKEEDINLANNSSTVDKEIFGLRMPNVITPDGDGKNDVLKIPGLKAYPENTLSVFNRWGNEVWYSNGAYQENWSGEGLNEGTYYYKLSLKDKTGKWITFIKWVTLLKD